MSLKDLLFAKKYDNSNGGTPSGDLPSFPIGDGDTHIWVHIADEYKTVQVGFAVNGTATIDWGDGTSISPLRGSNLTSVEKGVHTYSTAGDYVITIDSDAEIVLMGHGVSGVRHPAIFHPDASFSSSDTRYESFMSRIRYAELGNHVKRLDAYAFYKAHGLLSVSIPNSVTSISTYAFSGCSALTRIEFPPNIEFIGVYAFSGCPGVLYYDFTRCKAVPTLEASNAVRPHNYGAQIRIPAALVDEWKAATNWSTIADKIVGRSV